MCINSVSKVVPAFSDQNVLFELHNSQNPFLEYQPVQLIMIATQMSLDM